MGFETPEEGYLAKIFIEAGTRDIPIGKLLCIIVEEQEDVAKFADFDASSAAEAAAPAAAPAPAAAAPAPPPPPPPASTPAAAPVQRSAPVAGGKVFASPAAKRVAAEKGIDLSQIKSGSGMDGMITSKVSFNAIRIDFGLNNHGVEKPHNSPVSSITRNQDVLSPIIKQSPQPSGC